MSISDWIKNRRKRRLQREILRHRKRIKTKFGQEKYRHVAVEFFEELGGREGCRGLLERFMVDMEPIVQDEKEKKEVYDILVGFGAKVVPAVEEYINRNDETIVPIAWPLKILDRVAEPSEAVGVIVRTLKRRSGEYIRDPEFKVMLISQLANYEDPRVVPTLVAFLKDYRTEVQEEAVRSLILKGNDLLARTAILDLLADQDMPIRLRVSIAESLSRHGWIMKKESKKIEKVLPEGMYLDDSGRVHGRWVHASPVENDKVE